VRCAWSGRAGTEVPEGLSRYGAHSPWGLTFTLLGEVKCLEGVGARMATKNTIRGAKTLVMARPTSLRWPAAQQAGLTETQ
jgi:hypothetical protein